MSSWIAVTLHAQIFSCFNRSTCCSNVALALALVGISTATAELKQLLASKHPFSRRGRTRDERPALCLQQWRSTKSCSLMVEPAATVTVASGTPCDSGRRRRWRSRLATNQAANSGRVELETAGGRISSSGVPPLRSLQTAGDGDEAGSG
jgi:hypothetical protein